MTIFFVGPTRAPVTGQSLAFYSFFDAFLKDKSLFTFYDKNKGLVKFLVYSIFSYVLFFIKGVKQYKKGVLYITTSRTLLGFIRDSLYILIAILFRFKIVNHLHGADFISFREKNNRIRPLIDFIYSKIDVSVVLSDLMKEQYSMYPKMKVEVVRNFYLFDGDLSLFDNNFCNIKKRESNDTFQIVYISNIMYSKGILDLITAVKKMARDGYNVKLNIAGKPISDNYMDGDKLHNKVLKLVADDLNISYLGGVYGNDKENLLSSSHVSVLPSFYASEAQPISIIESMRFGCAIITTNHNYLTDIGQEGENCLFVKPEDSEEIRKALIRLYEKPQLCFSIGQKNVLLAKEKYTFLKYFENLNNILGNL